MKFNNNCSLFLLSISLTVLLLSGCKSTELVDSQEFMKEIYGENRKIEGDYDKALSVKCHNGIFVGLKSDDVISFKGIPFAKPPVGNLRWKESVEAEEDSCVYEAYFFGKSPLQSEWPSEVGSYYPQSEDCLKLNVWINDSNKSKDKTVMVFFHGGSYGWGGTSDPIYDGKNLVQKFDDIILVTVEYRLGMMGFIDFSSVEGGEEFSKSGNLGLLDQVCALKWIKKNIAGFGGNPDNVTIFGESAGGGSVSLLPLVKEAQGLFNRVIAESGSVCLSFSKEECQNQTKLLLKYSGCKNMTELMNLTEDQLMEIEEKISDYNCFPERDGITLPVDVYSSYEKNDICKVDMLIGTNKDECRYWINEMGYYTNLVPGILIYKIGIPKMYKKNLSGMSEEDKDSIYEFRKRLNDKKYLEVTEFYNEILFRLPAVKQCEALSKNGNKVYNYYWTRGGSNKTTGACHAIELSYVFNNLNVKSYTGDDVNQRLAEEVQKMWVNFARSGDPSTEAYIWNEYNCHTRKTMILGDEIYETEDLLAEQRKLLFPALKYQLNGTYVGL